MGKMPGETPDIPEEFKTEKKVGNGR